MRSIIDEYGEAIVGMVIGLLLLGCALSASYYITINI